MKKVITAIFTLLLVFVVKTPVYAGTEAVMTENTIRTSGLENLNYLLYKPENATTDMPLIVYLHGGSGKGEDLSLLTANDGFPKYLKEGALGNIPAYVVMPQLSSSKKGWDDIKIPLRELINYVSEMYSIDTNRVSLTGHSMGGTGTWSIAASCPRLFSCIAPLSGSIKFIIKK